MSLKSTRPLPEGGGASNRSWLTPFLLSSSMASRAILRGGGLRRPSPPPGGVERVFNGGRGLGRAGPCGSGERAAGAGGRDERRLGGSEGFNRMGSWQRLQRSTTTLPVSFLSTKSSATLKRAPHDLHVTAYGKLLRSSGSKAVSPEAVGLASRKQAPGFCAMSRVGNARDQPLGLEPRSNKRGALRCVYIRRGSPPRNYTSGGERAARAPQAPRGTIADSSRPLAAPSRRNEKNWASSRTVQPQTSSIASLSRPRLASCARTMRRRSTCGRRLP